MSDTSVPTGEAIIERIGWEENEDGSRSDRFTATLVFPNGPPEDISAAVVWGPIPVRIVRTDKEATP